MFALILLYFTTTTIDTTVAFLPSAKVCKLPSRQKESRCLSELHSTNINTFQSTPGLFGSSNWFNDFDRDEDDLSFLPINTFDLPPKTYDILRKVSKAFVDSDVKDTSKDIDFLEVVDVIDSEYKFSALPFSLGESSFELTGNQNETQVMAQQIFSKVLSFAALHRLPKDLALFLFGNLTDSEQQNIELKRLVSLFYEESWANVSFPSGLSVRLKREYLQPNERFSVVPRQSIFTKAQNSLRASEAINESENTAPPLKRIKKQDLVADLDEIERELGGKSGFAQDEDSSYKDLLTFFPRPRKLGIISRVRKATLKQSRRLKKMGRAGVISYGILNFLWYTVAVVWRWQRLGITGAALVEGRAEALMLSFRKFA